MRSTMKIFKKQRRRKSSFEASNQDEAKTELDKDKFTMKHIISIRASEKNMRTIKKAVRITPRLRFR